MGAIILFVILFVITIAAFWGGVVLLNNNYEFLSILCLVIAVVFVFASIFAGVNLACWGLTKIELASEIEYRQQRHDMYVEMLDVYSQLQIQDVTGSEQYMALYKEILDFNHQVDRFENYGHQWWTEGLMWDPSYTGVEKVPIHQLR